MSNIIMSKPIPIPQQNIYEKSSDEKKKFQTQTTLPKTNS